MYGTYMEEAENAAKDSTQQLDADEDDAHRLW